MSTQSACLASLLFLFTAGCAELQGLGSKLGKMTPSIGGGSAQPASSSQSSQSNGNAGGNGGSSNGPSEEPPAQTASKSSVPASNFTTTTTTTRSHTSSSSRTSSEDPPAPGACLSSFHYRVAKGPWMNSKASLDAECDPDNIGTVQRCALGMCIGWRDSNNAHHGKCMFAASELRQEPALGEACTSGLRATKWHGGVWCMPNEIDLCPSEQERQSR